jgi:hypothetical protein
MDVEMKVEMKTGLRKEIASLLLNVDLIKNKRLVAKELRILSY